MEYVISLKDINKSYQINDNEIPALVSLNLNIRHKEFIAIMGPSGSGKSSLLNILGCLDTPTSGQYILDGEDVSRLDHDRLAAIRNNKIGFVFQNFNLLSQYSITDNVMLPLIYAETDSLSRLQRSLESLKSVGLEKRYDHKPNQISGGEKQRVAIARALINNPSIILADEPTGNLDSSTSKDIMELVTKVHKEGNTIILVTHEEDIAAYAERIIRLKDGQIENDITKQIKKRLTK